MNPLHILAQGAGTNPLLPNGWEITVTVVGILFYAALVVAVIMLTFKLLTGTKTRTATSASRESLQDEIARRTDSIENRLGNIERTFQNVGE
ncbi:hypothetical protein CQ018_19460 [Arthrobacter sp. MYb227]|uniref:hypothetical protein n=1 Tax=Arthrobacter sp. MYb227 TaxID=1848601 RepID=UPI000CFAABAB|nr:hypothetical protein [Arthrobacter sp. MYb227]PQZ85959.1 hypothetical protein CQ018_19460 [Arthrobacter sp. MYb227]